MKVSRTLLLALTGALILSCGCSQEKKQIAESDVSDLIRINQVGYYPSLGKRFTVADKQAEYFLLINDKGKIVFRGKLSDEGLWEPSGETLKSGDFSEFNKEGTYFIHISGTGNSYPFKISNGIYESAAVDALETFYFIFSDAVLLDTVLYPVMGQATRVISITACFGLTIMKRLFQDISPVVRMDTCRIKETWTGQGLHTPTPIRQEPTLTIQPVMLRTRSASTGMHPWF